MNLRLFSLTWQKKPFYSQLCGNEEYSLQIKMDARGYTKEPSDGVTVC